jgi:hypothetical protein
MTINEELIMLCNNKIAYLESVRVIAFNIGNISEVNNIDAKILETKQELFKLQPSV